MNRLKSSHSPYLLQHASNPVHWQPWDKVALTQAIQTNKPILLSVGYSACHWCHVMEDESFSDSDIAAIMNANFINIKVDREERPDIDRIYQAAHYIFTRHPGGWPLTMFLTPSQEAFFGGTYFPKQTRGNLPSFTQVLERVVNAWNNQQQAIQQQNKTVLSLLQSLDTYTPTEQPILSDAPVVSAISDFKNMFDAHHGGLGNAPKFPHPVELAFCLEVATQYGDTALLAAVQDSLEKIAASGLTDHIGGGFFRYCVDARWHLPHFEKMLYDNALLLALFTDAQIAFSPTHKAVVSATARWLLNDMRHPDGYFYASMDADSTEGEGAFYLWDKAGLQSLLEPEEYDIFSSHYGLGVTAPVDGKWHLVRCQSVAETAAGAGISSTDCDDRLQRSVERLAQHRRSRTNPRIDNKILTAWNGLAIQGLARAGRLCNQDEWTSAAKTALNRIIAIRNKQGRTPANCHHHQPRSPGFLDDSAFLLAAALELLHVEISPDILAVAHTIATELSAHFVDADQGGFFFTAHDSEVLIRRVKSIDDGATPSGNGIALQSLLTLSRLSGQVAWQETAAKGLSLFYQAMNQQSTGTTSLLRALNHYLHPPLIILLNGDLTMCRQWQKAIEAVYRPTVLVYCLPPNSDRLPVVLQKPRPDSGALAYVCSASSCADPIDNLTQLKERLRI